MRVFDPSLPCDSCGEALRNWDYRYRGKHYCRKCYQQYFSLQKCTECGKNKMIFKALSIPLCKICRVKDEPCLRCSCEIKHFGKILENGVVCASCARYFTSKKVCSLCKKESHHVFHYTIDEKKVLSCTSCYNKTLPICHLCQRHKKTYMVTKEGKSVCKACCEGERKCQQCGMSFPAGRGRICMECSRKNGLNKKVAFGKKSLSPYYCQIFVNFSEWLLNKRGAAFASHRILYFFPFFKDLDMYAEILHRKPSYQEMLSHLSVARCRTNHTVMTYLNYARYIKIDPEIKEEYANFDMIGRYLQVFQRDTLFKKLDDGYYQHLEHKHLNGKIKIRSVRLALSTAINFLRYCQHCKVEKPSKKMLHDYLWCFWGQKASLTGFINYLNREHGYQLNIHSISKPVLFRPTNSREILKQRFIHLLRKNKEGNLTNSDQLIRVSIGYLHRINIPQEINIGFLKVTKISRGYLILFAKRKFYIPNDVMHYYLSTL